MTWSHGALGAVALMALCTVACNDGTGLGNPAPLAVTLQQASNAGGSPSLQIVGEQGAAALITLSDVDSLDAQLTHVEALPQSSMADSTNDAAWISVAVVGNGFINLVKLPTTTQGPLVVASDSVPAGTYGDLRFFLQGLTIWFNRQIAVGQILLQPNTPYTVTMPSGAQTGLKTKAQFTLPDGGGQVNIVFDATSTLANLSVTGMGGIVVAPVLTEK
jgi:Domain of unknown function (DUF4382)